MKGEKYFEHIHENFVPNDKDHVISTFVTKDNEVRVVSNNIFSSEFHFEEKKEIS